MQKKDNRYHKFDVYINKIKNEIDKDLRISKDAKEIINMMVEDFISKISREVLSLMTSSKRKRIDYETMMEALKLVTSYEAFLSLNQKAITAVYYYSKK